MEIIAHAYGAISVTMWSRDSMFSRSVASLQKMNLNNSFEEPILPQGEHANLNSHY